MHIIQSLSTSPTFNLAAEEYLFSERGDELLFLYVNEPSVIIGSNQVLRNEVNEAFCTEHHLCIVRRMSGGGAVYHDQGNLNYCFIRNKTAGEFPLSGEFLQPVVKVLHTLQIDVQTGKRKDLLLPGGYKISGTASHIGKIRELHHGTLLYDADLEKLNQSLTVKEKDVSLKGIASVPGTVKNIRTFIEEQSGDSPDSAAFFHLLILEFASYYHSPVTTLTDAEITAIRTLQNQKYTQKEWTCRK